MAKETQATKKYLPVIMLIALIGIMLVSTYMVSPLKAFAAEGDLVIEETYPKDGANNAAVENLGVKITFNNPVNSAENQEANSKCFKIKGPEGNELPIKVYFNEKEPKQILVLYDVTTGGQLSSRGSETFTIDISGEFKDNDGNTLGKDTTLTFSTINQSRNTTIYMVMMFAMIIGMAIFTSIQTRKRMEERENKNKPKKDEPFNPYKEAKKTGRPVQDIIQDHEKEMAKKAKEQEEWDDDWAEEEEDKGTYKVKMPRPISYYGSKYAEKRKVEIEQKRLEREARAPKKNKGKKKK